MLVPLGFLLVAVLLAQHCFYRVDGQGLVVGLVQPAFVHDRHPLFLPLARLLAAPLLALGLTPFRCLTLLSALGIATALLLFGRAAARLGLEPARRGLLVLAIACCPSLLFFATVVEFHGLFLAFAALVWRLAVEVERRTEAGCGGIAWGLLLGTATGVAAMVHGLGQLLVLVVPFWLWIRSGPVWRRRVWALLAAVLAHVVLVVLIPFTLPGPVQAVAEATKADATRRQLGYLMQFVEHHPPFRELATGLADEWLLAFLPLSLTCFLAAGRARERLLLGLAVSGYLVLTWILTPGLSEWGAYLQPLVWPAALLALAVERRALLVALSLAGLVLGVLWVRGHDHPVPGLERMRTWLAVAEEEPSFLLFADRDEGDALLLLRPTQPHGFVEEALAVFAARNEGFVALQLLNALVREQQHQGRRVLVSEATQRALAAASGLAGEELALRYDLEARAAQLCELRLRE